MASNVLVSKRVYKRGAGKSSPVESFELFDSNVHLSLIEAEITEGPASEALVNCTGPHFEYQTGISAAITRAAGIELIQEFNRLADNGRLHHAQVVDTPPFKLAPKHKVLFHVRSPNFRNNCRFVGTTQVRLTSLTYLNLLKAAFVEHNLKSMTLPLIGTGACGLPIEESVADLVDAIVELLQDADFDAKRERKIFLINNESPKIIVISEAIESALERLHAAKQPTRPPQAPAAATSQVASKVSTTNGDGEKKTCVICLDDLPMDPRDIKALAKCGHEFCKDCIDGYFASAKKSCPVCNTVYGVTDGTQPDGTMSSRLVSQSLPGFPGAQTIEITYHIPGGIQGSRHPNPGRRFSGTHRTAYLPDTREGREVLDLLKRAFDHKLVFTIGQSRTTGAEDAVTWNDIHHKTSMHGGTSHFGYPDPTYLNRVKQELADKGIC